MKHFICTGDCGSVSDAPGVCSVTNCPNYDQELSACECKDGKHVAVLKKCENCGKICQGNCDIDTFKPELPA